MLCKLVTNLWVADLSKSDLRSMWALPVVLLALSLGSGPAVASSQSGDSFIRASHTLIESAAPSLFDAFFSKTTARLIDGQNPPLARYQPSPKGGVVEFGHDLHRYKSEYTIATVVIPKSQRPDFDQYMVVLTALSLANEKAHFDQDQAGSLKDFFALKAENETAKYCALYGLQQHVSDIVMLDMAIRLSDYFIKRQSAFGQNAVTAALDRMDLLPLYQEFRSAAAAKDRVKMTDILRRLKASRAAINIANLPECGPTGEAELSRAVISRAVASAYPYLLPPGSLSLAPSSDTSDYNQ